MNVRKYIDTLPKIYWAGDSTVKQNDYTSYPQCGIGQAFNLFIKKDIAIVNRAENGRSTKSFIDEGRLEYIKENIKEGDFLFIQFGHNDEKDDPLRHTDAFGTFTDNLKLFINVAQEAKAYPLLITPLYRRLFEQEHKLIDNTHLDYPEAMLRVGKELNIPVIDLCALSKQVIENEGDTLSRRWFMHIDKGEYPNYPDGKNDNTHLVYAGAVRFAGIIATELAKVGGVYSDILLEKVYEDPQLLID